MKLEFSEFALGDLERIYAFYAERDPANGIAQVRLIRSAVEILAIHPRIGRPATGWPLRELVISASKDGFVALYDYDPVGRLVRIVAVRHQREVGYRFDP